MSGWVAWLVGCVVLAALVSAGIVVAAGDDRPGGAVVSATADRSGTVDVTSTVTVPLPLPSTPSPTTTLRTTTTLSPAAVAVLRAIASTTTTTQPPATTTTTSPAPTTTVTPTTFPPPTTTRVPRFVVDLENAHPRAFVLTLNGRDFPLAPGQTQKLVEMPVSPSGKDVVVVRVPGDPDCGVTDTGALFPDGSRKLLRIVPRTGTGTCSGDFAFPQLEITPL